MNGTLEPDNTYTPCEMKREDMNPAEITGVCFPFSVNRDVNKEKLKRTENRSFINEKDRTDFLYLCRRDACDPGKFQLSEYLFYFNYTYFLRMSILFILLLVSNSTAFASSFPRIVNDMSGTVVRIDSPPRRIITVGPSATEIIFSLVENRRIIAVSNSSNYPPEALKKEKIGDIYLNFEKIVNLKPDLVVVESSLNGNDIFKLRKLGIKTLAIKSDTYANFHKSVNIAGKAVGKSKLADKLNGDLSRKLSFIRSKVKNVPYSSRPRVFVEIWDKPLMTAGSGTFIDYVIENAGGVNVAADMSGYPQINNETLIVRNPDVVILTSSTREKFYSVPLWKNMNAVKNDRVYSINPDILVRPTMRLYEGCRTLYNRFYPDTAVSER